MPPLTAAESGQTFGDLLFTTDDGRRSASVVADEATRLLVITDDVYSRTVGVTLRNDYLRRWRFVNDSSLFRSWTSKMKKQLTSCLRTEHRAYDSVALRQGDPVDYMYFIER